MLPRVLFEQLSLIQDAENALCESLETKKTYEVYASELERISKYLNREDIDQGTRMHKDAILAIYRALQKKKKHTDNTDLMVEINNIINEYVTVEKTDVTNEPSKKFDISGIDFDILVKEFSNKRKNLVMKDLTELLEIRLESMVSQI